MKNQPPKRFQKFMKSYPKIAKAYQQMGDVVHNAGPLDEKTRALIKVAISGGARMEGAFHAHVRKAKLLGIKKEEIMHLVLLTLPTLGFPTMNALMTWVEDIY